MRSQLLTAFFLTASVSMSQGQTLAVDSFPRATVVDSARVGPLIYRAVTTLSYPKKAPVESKVATGNLTTSLTITNAGPNPTETIVARCPLRVNAFMTPDFRVIERISDFPTTAPCFASVQKLTLRSGESRRLSLSTRDWEHGRFGFLGPLYFADELQLSDTTVSLRAGKTKFASDISSLDYSASSVVKGVAPASLITRVVVSNGGTLPVDLQFGACTLKLRGYRSPDKSGQPVWYSELGGLPFIKHAQQMCVLVLYHRTLGPGQSVGAFGSKIPTYEILADSLPEGRYYFTAQLELNNQLFTFDAGSAVVSSKQQPLPRSRTIDSVQFSASVTRVRFGNGIPDSLDVTFKAHNTTNATRWLSAEGNPGCLGIMGYKTRERRDSYYLRPAYDNDWIIRPCPFPVSEFGLAAGEVRVTTKRIPAPPSALHYMMYFEFRDKAVHSPEPTLSGDLAVDEGTNR